MRLWLGLVLACVTAVAAVPLPDTQARDVSASEYHITATPTGNSAAIAIENQQSMTQEMDHGYVFPDTHFEMRARFGQVGL